MGHKAQQFVRSHAVEDERKRCDDIICEEWNEWANARQKQHHEVGNLIGAILNRVRFDAPAMTQTPPAADGGLPGPLGSETTEQAFTQPEEFWPDEPDMAQLEAKIAAQAAIIAEKDAALAGKNAELEWFLAHCGALEAQLAAATTRLASAEAVIASLLDIAAVWETLDGRKNIQLDASDTVKHARAWLTSKDGEKQP